MPPLTPPADLGPLRPALDAGELILTANQRLARALEQAWGAELAAAGGHTWRRPRIHALEHWFEGRWQELRDAAFEPALAGTPAAPAVELRLWHRVIADSPETPPGDPAFFAELAQSARQLLERWDLDDRAAGPNDSLLSHWLPQWRKAMKSRELLTREQTLELLLAGRAAGALPDAGAAHLVGFTSLPPRYQRVLESLCSRVIQHPPATPSGALRLATAADPAAELAAAADWAVARLQEAPQARIGIVIPDLAAARDAVERLLRDRLTPAHSLPDRVWNPPPCNISAAQPLAALPLPRTALGLLSLLTGSVSSGAACALLQDPCWGDAATELEVRVRAELELRDRSLVTPSAADLRDALVRAEAACHQPGLVSARLQGAVELHRRAPRRAGFRTWARHVRDCLERLDWPGRRGLDSHEFQQLQHWDELLERFAALAVTGEEIDWPDALDELRRQAAATAFQAQTPETGLQVLGVLEAAGLRFDALWVTGMTDERWPEPLDPHPLLPVALQRRLAMPRAQPARELDIALARLHALQTAAPEVVFSHPEREGEAELRVFAALRGLPAAAAAAPQPQPRTRSLTDVPAMETLAWGDAPPCTADEFRSGGSARLRDQSGCPFNAFATWRLGARPLPEPEPGLSRIERGELVHRALELFWSALPDQGALLALGESGRRQRLHGAIEGALNELARSRRELRGPRLHRVETACLFRLLEAWLAVELAREPFAVVAREQRLDLDLEGLPVRLRIDRIDRLADGRLLLLDYKTGAARAGGWDGDRPEEPQLPLYALAAAEPLAGLALARVRIDERQGCGFAGIADGALPGCKPLAEHGLPGDWAGALAHWRQALGTLAREFLNGTATIGHYHRSSADRDPLTALNRLPEIDMVQMIIDRS